ncbi:hypothetical protein FQN55_008845 [Onygenales sp. PD_40]|nr:hypothetical protein FQN55_008845 [Onygenales sp. PD_40]KAK2783049.1 hypothetical protein FQN52_000494 [Onygenales sp. PD_12]KAK2794877.1 hypothetical protein FQN51_000620 [Onygenales sp. PD_10]
MALPMIHQHSTPESSLIPLLRSHLPYSGPLLRRFQHHVLYPAKTASILATFPATSSLSTPSAPWLAAYVDLHSGGTQIWIYSSVEAGVSSPTLQAQSLQSPGAYQRSKLNLDRATEAQVQAQLLSLCQYIDTHLLPSYVSSLPATAKEEQTSTPSPSGNTLKKLPSVPANAFLIGSLHTGLDDLLSAAIAEPGKLPPHLPRIHCPPRDAAVCMKYLFRQTPPPSASGNPGAALPPGYRFHDRIRRGGVQPYQLDLVISRTHIPRTKHALSKLESVALYYGGGDDSSNVMADHTHSTNADEMPIGWVFLNPDGSLCSLHVEEEHRGRGLAAFLAREVMKIGMGEGGTFASGISGGEGEGKDEGWAFADVEVNNTASHKVMGKMGGVPGWTVRWVAVGVVKD